MSKSKKTAPKAKKASGIVVNVDTAKFETPTAAQAEAAAKAAPKATKKELRAERAALGIAKKAAKPAAKKAAKGKAAKAAKPAAEKKLGKRAQVEANAKEGKLPAKPDFSAETHKRFRPHLDAVAAMVADKDISGLRKWKWEGFASSSPKAIIRYRDLALMALEAKAAR